MHLIFHSIFFVTLLNMDIIIYTMYKKSSIAPILLYDYRDFLLENIEN